MKTLVAALVLALSTCAFSLVAFGADKAPTVVKKDALPGNLKGGKDKAAKVHNDGIPLCMSGDRAKLTGNDHDREPLLTWAGSHQSHACFGADTVYVCWAGKNLSVRCE